MSDAKYWDDFYSTNTGTFEWLLSYKDIKNNLEHLFESKNKLLTFLDLGCGSSNLLSDILQTLPYAHGVFFDISHGSLIAQQSNNNVRKESNSCHYVQGSVLHLPFQENTFDFVIDKGTMDSLLKAKDNGKVSSRVMLQQVHSVLRPGGLCLQISDEDPEIRMDLIINNWEHGAVNFKEISVNQREIFLYLLHKRPC